MSKKKVTVFGGAGFLGSHVAEALTEAGHAVTIFDLMPAAPLLKGQKTIVGDIANPREVEKAVRGADVVYNFAGIADLAEAHAKPVETVSINILGNAVILEACAKAKIKRYVFASTLYVYSQAGSFYSASKQACEAYIENYRRYRGLDYTILRYGSLYGDRASGSNTVSRFLTQALNEGRMVYFGDGEETREYIHIDDAARYSVEALAPEFANQNLLITGHQAIKVRELMEMINEILGGKVSLEFKKPSDRNALDTHYRRTPYNFTPRPGRKLLGRQYIDLGQGLLRLLDQIHANHERGESSQP